MDCTRCKRPNDSGDSFVCRSCLEARDNIPEFRQLSGRTRRASKVSKGVGMSVPACIRAYAMSEFGMTYADANCLATDVEDHLRGADWLELSNGLMFDRGFDPAK